jgi:hypothetical protein
MKNTPSIYFAAVVLLLSCTLTAQSESKWSVGLQVGAANYFTLSDFEEVVYTIEGSAYHYGRGNITEANVSPALGLEAMLEINPRWRLIGFGQLQAYSGTLYENDFTIFGPSSTLEEPVEFRAPADNDLTVFQLGLQAQHRVLRGRNIRGYLGGGLSFLSRSHTYRDRLEVDFSESRQPNSIAEFYTTANETTLAIPLTARLERELSQNVFLSLSGQLTVFPNLEDHQILGLVGIHYRL